MPTEKVPHKERKIKNDVRRILVLVGVGARVEVRVLTFLSVTLMA